MVGKIRTPKSNKAEALVKSVFERFSFVNLEDDDLIRKPIIYVPDFVFEFEKNKFKKSMYIKKTNNAQALMHIYV